MHFFSFAFREVCNDRGHLTQSGTCYHRTLSGSWMSFVLRTCTSWLEKERPTRTREGDITTLATSKVAHAEFHRISMSSDRCTKVSQSQKNPTRNHTMCSLNPPTRPKTVRHTRTVLLACTIGIRTYSGLENTQIGQDAPKELKSTCGCSSDVN